MQEEFRESFCFAVLNLRRCAVVGDDPALAYDCRVISSNGESAEDTVVVPVLLTDSDGARRHKVAEAISLHFRERYNISESTVLFG